MPKANCPECHEEVFVDAECEQGDTVHCEECGVDLEVVGLDPVELDVADSGGFDDEDEEFDGDGF